MGRLEELIDKYCPDGVEYLKLGDIVTFINGRAYKQTELLASGKYRVLRVGNFFTSDKWYYSDLDLEEDKYCNAGDLLYAWAASLGPRIWNEEKTIFHYHIWKLKFDEAVITKKYLYHYLLKDLNDIYGSLTHSTMPHVSMANMKERIIPVPPLPVQEEIVRILDRFSTLEAELETELETELDMRKKQYEYYRDKMLSLEDYDGEVEEVSLGTIARISRGGNFQKKDFVSNGKPCIHYGQIYTRYGLSTDTSLTSVNEDVWNKSKKAKKGNIVMAVTSENYDDVCKCVVWEGDEDAAISGHTAIIDHDVDAHYLAHYFNSSHFYKQKLKIAHGTKVIEVTPVALNDIVIKMPKDVNEQARIANLLDGFKKLIDDISEGLPAEIKMRHQQYEYYRDKLLSFKKKKKVS